MASTSIKEVLSLGRLKHLCLHMKSYPVMLHRHQGPNSAQTDIPLGMARIVIHWMSAKTTDFYKSLLSTQPRQPGLVFCSANSNAKQALQTRRTTASLKCVLVKGKGGCCKVPSKSEQKINRVYSHTHMYMHFFSSLLLAAQNCLQNKMFWFCPAETESCHVVEWHCVGERDTAQNSHTGTGSWAYPTGVNSHWPQQGTGSVTCTSDSMECHRCLFLMLKMQNWAGECWDPRA